MNSLIAIMATPLLTGPATISFITIKSMEIGMIPVFINLCAAFILVGTVFMLFSVFIDRINTKVIGIMSRVLGLFLSAIAIEMISAGIEGTIADLKK
jgi:multiple antibiotic resistance protein